MASVATWADENRKQMLWSGAMHFVNALEDNPPSTCAFPGPSGWAGKQGSNVLDGIKNTTHLLQKWVNHDESDIVANEALKFLIHFLGDMHQPLHLTGKHRGGNCVAVLFEEQETTLHILWDHFLVARAIRTTSSNYSRPLPLREVEDALRGSTYDPFIRRIVSEGLLGVWADDLKTWFSCPAPNTASKDIVSDVTRITRGLVNVGVEINPDGPIVCPYYWAQPLHELNCELVWPKELESLPYNQPQFESNSAVSSECEKTPPLDLDVSKYADVIERDMVVEKLLAQGGIRLAGLLNYIFANKSQPTLPITWSDDFEEAM
ncbi:Endonuclease 3 [Psilocybe cubensis]|uniref:Endonuclease 3 n=1 Tax=Psilocybe cubensis TaxID=181762 RepID=A0ACB8GQW7_PSICU|nr:Endonuclease 3 [Psilocybe cubensis]KAH9477946.1 Endonuclease 3 [Psilocybe cubensis]